MNRVGFSEEESDYKKVLKKAVIRMHLPSTGLLKRFIFYRKNIEKVCSCSKSEQDLSDLHEMVIILSLPFDDLEKRSGRSF